MVQSKILCSPVAVASYLVIDGHKRATGEVPTGLYFNKVMSLLHHGMKEEGVDIALPHCWYRWGDEVVRYLMPTAIEWNHEEVALTTVNWRDYASSYVARDELFETMKRRVDELTGLYAGAGGVERAVEKVYSYAPFEFQRRFKTCRDSLRTVRHRSVNVDGYGSKVLWPRVETACESFPRDDFPEVARLLPVFKDTMKSVLLASEPNYDLADELSEEFWSWFCYYLRIHPRAHENVPDETLDFWRERMGWEGERYRKMLGDHVVELARRDSRISEHIVLGPVASSRLQELRSEEETLASFDDDFEGLDDFLREVRGNYRAR